MRKTKNIQIMMLMAALTLLWGCSSDDDNKSNGQPGSHSTVTTVTMRPNWSINWMSDATEPNWQEAPASKYECSMDMMVELDDEAVSYSTDDDLMAVFIGGECRGVSNRNKMTSGKVAFLLHIKGSSEEVDASMQIRYYSGGAHHLSITEGVPPFTPNNLMDETYQLVLSLAQGSQKYPLFTQLEVLLPDELPFTVQENDILAVFVGDECRGIGEYNPELYLGWRMNVYNAREDEVAHVRYYSSEQNCIYTFQQTFTLNGYLQGEKLQF